MLPLLEYIITKAFPTIILSSKPDFLASNISSKSWCIKTCTGVRRNRKVYILIRLNFYNFHNHFASKQSWFISRRPHSIKQTIKNFPCIHSFTTFPVHINNCTTKIDIAFKVTLHHLTMNVLTKPQIFKTSTRPKMVK